MGEAVVLEQLDAHDNPVDGLHIILVRGGVSVNTEDAPLQMVAGLAATFTGMG